MKEEISNKLKATVITNALPYMQKYSGKIVVIKYGGNAMGSVDLKKSVMKDIVLLSQIGVKVVLVHGGGPEITEMLSKIGKESKFIEGLRYTDDETAEVAQMVLAGKINKQLVNNISFEGGKAVGISGSDGDLLIAEKKDFGKYGNVGEIKKVNTQLLLELLKADYIPVVSSITTTQSGEILNINADTAASEIATALKAENLILLTDVKGLLEKKDDESSLIPEVKASEVAQLVKKGIIQGGMIPKVECCVKAIRNGVKQAIIIDGRVEHSIIIEMFSRKGIGTLFYA